MQDLELIIIIGGIINLIVIYLIISRLGTLIKEQKKTNYLLFKKMEKDGHEFTVEDLNYLNK